MSSVLRNEASQTARDINGAFRSDIITQRIVSKRFAKFRSGNFEFTNEQLGQSETKTDNDKLKATVVLDASQSSREL